MSRKKPDKNIVFLEPSFREILVCKPKNARPYMEVFVHEPENVFQQNLGTLFGVLEINDESPDSSYVVNYLISVIKKEFFSNVKRGTIESFEAALHKANLALSKLAEHDHISWIGKINAICAVTEKNNIHLTQTGSACALLLRSKALVNISEGGENEDPNPLKTFQEVVSGRLEDGDKIIVTTGEIFDIFSLEEIKRSAIKFSREDFFRFLNTALVNELERAAVLIADVSEKVELEPEPAKKSPKINAFSQSAFFQNHKKKEEHSKSDEEKSALMDELKKELEKTKEGYRDEKTGHIYIKDDGIPGATPSALKDYSTDFYDKIKSFGKDSLRKIKKGRDTKRVYPESPEMPVSETAEAYSEDNAANIPAAKREPEARIKINYAAKLSAMRSSLSAFGSKIIPALSFVAFHIKLFAINRIYVPLKKLLSTTFTFLKSQLAKLVKKKDAPPPAPEYKKFDDYAQRPEVLSSSRQEKRDWFNALSDNGDSQAIASSRTAQDYYQPEPASKRFLPSMEKIRELFARFSRREKIIAGLVVAILVVVPYFIAKALERSKGQKTPVAVETPAAPTPLENDKNVARLTSVDNIVPGNFETLVNVNGKIFAAGENSITALEDNKTYDIASEFQNPDLVFAMDDLNLIFLYKDGKIISLHAVSRKYQNNNISVPGGADIVSGASYLTYGYLLDAKNNQIYRYPRAEGGFGEKTDWLKDKTDLSSAKDMAINENVYVTDGKNISKFYRGKKQDFAIEETTTPISIDRIYTKPDSQNLYILDKTNSRIIKLDADGNIATQYYHPEIGTAFDFAVDESAQKIYVTDENGIGSFGMN
ncbi:MAG: hypothetical protein WCV59_00315 [Parcubacteria group bacterium]|jgi:hypothetical protein